MELKRWNEWKEFVSDRLPIGNISLRINAGHIHSTCCTDVKIRSLSQCASTQLPSSRLEQH